MQCIKCQQFGHGNMTCKNTPKCRIYSKNMKQKHANAMCAVNRVASGAVRCGHFRHRTDGAPMHKLMHKFMHACIKSIKIKYTNSQKMHKFENKCINLKTNA